MLTRIFDCRIRATTNDIQRLDKFARKGVRVTEADTLGRKDWFARMGIPSRFEDPDAHYVIEDGILKLRINRDLPRRRKPSASAVSSKAQIGAPRDVYHMSRLPKLPSRQVF